MQPISFEQFMAQALHDPQRGYYARRIHAIGRCGDFTTAPMLSEKPARAIAAWATRALRDFHCRNLIEVGPGEGTLAASILQHLPWPTRLRTRLHLVETSASLTARQQQLIGKRAIWHSSLQDALTACGGNAIIYSNEFVDAYPVRRFQKTSLGWQELTVSFDEQNQVHESLLPLAQLPDSSTFLGHYPDGQWIEVHDSYRRHLHDWLPLWKCGRMLTIDYGATVENLYQRRPRGSIRAYRLHQRLEGRAIYDHPGHQDITADVNFTDLQNWSRPWTSEATVHTFREFLHASGNDDFTDPNGAGDAFLVLDQRR